MFLKHIADIQTGVFANTVSEGEIVYLKAKHFDENGQLSSVLHPDLNASDITEQTFTQARVMFCLLRRAQKILQHGMKIKTNQQLLLLPSL